MWKSRPAARKVKKKKKKARFADECNFVFKIRLNTSARGATRSDAAFIAAFILKSQQFCSARCGAQFGILASADEVLEKPSNTTQCI